MASQAEQLSNLNVRLSVIEDRLKIDPNKHPLRNVVVGCVLTAVLAGIGWWGWFVTTNVLAMKQALVSNGTQLVAELKNPKSGDQLKANLSTVVAQVQNARVRGIKPDQSKVFALSEAVSQAAKKNPDVPEVWQAAMQLVDYRSASAVSLQSLPPCSGGEIVVTGGPDTAQMLATASFSNCVLDLDEPSLWTNSKSSGHIESSGRPVTNWHLNLHNVIVHYSGGSSLAYVSKIIFDHCVLDFQFAQPSMYSGGQLLMAQLLAAPNPADVEVTLG